MVEKPDLQMKMMQDIFCQNNFCLLIFVELFSVLALHVVMQMILNYVGMEDPPSGAGE